MFPMKCPFSSQDRSWSSSQVSQKLTLVRPELLLGDAFFPGVGVTSCADKRATLFSPSTFITIDLIQRIPHSYAPASSVPPFGEVTISLLLTTVAPLLTVCGLFSSGLPRCLRIPLLCDRHLPPSSCDSRSKPAPGVGLEPAAPSQRFFFPLFRDFCPPCCPLRKGFPS